MDYSERLGRFVEFLKASQKIAVLSGAGMSTESGIPDFRSTSGLYKTVTSEEVFDIGCFRQSPEKFYDIIAPLYVSMLEAKPNSGHKALSELELDCGKDVIVATQNIDGLHQKAGSKVVNELHGGMLSLTCQSCGGQVPASAVDADLRSGKVVRHRPTCNGVLKPDIVFFGEMLPEEAFSASISAMKRADLVLVLGTSLAVYPAASLPGLRRGGTPLVIINKTETNQNDNADLVYHESLGEVLPQALKQLKSGL